MLFSIRFVRVDDAYRLPRHATVATTTALMTLLGVVSFIICTCITPSVIQSLVNHGLILPSSMVSNAPISVVADIAGIIIATIILLWAVAMQMEETMLYRPVSYRYLCVWVAIHANLRSLLWFAELFVMVTTVLVAGDAVATSLFKAACGF